MFTDFVERKPLAAHFLGHHLFLFAKFGHGRVDFLNIPGTMPGQGRGTEEPSREHGHHGAAIRVCLIMSVSRLSGTITSILQVTPKFCGNRTSVFPSEELHFLRSYPMI